MHSKLFEAQRTTQRAPALFGIMMLTVVVLPRLHELVPLFVHLRLGLTANALCLAIIYFSKCKIAVPWFRLPQVNIYLFYTFWMFLSSFFGVWPSASLNGMYGFGLGVLFFAFMLKTVDSIDSLIKIVFILILSMMALDIVIVSRAAMGRADPGGYTLDANEVALLITVTIPFCYYFFRSTKRISRIASFIAMLLGVAAIFATASRGGFITLCAVLCYGFFLEKGPVIKKIVLIASVLFLVFFLMPETMRDRFSRLGDPEQDYNLTSKHGRSMVWDRAVSMIKERPMLGVGLGNFIFSESEINNQSRGVVAHNFVLQVATELGVPGALGLLSIFFVSWRNLRFIRHKYALDVRSMRGALLASVECGWVAFFIGGQFLSVAFSSQIIFLAGCSALLWKFYLRNDFDIKDDMKGCEG